MATGTDNTVLAALLTTLHREERTGVLHVQASATATRLYFSRGRVVFAEGGMVGDTLGRVLLRESKLTNAQYAEVIDRMTSRLVDNETLRFGEVAVELGFLAPADINDALAAQVRRKLMRCLQWDAVDCIFVDNEEAVSRVVHFPADTTALVADGVRRFFDFNRTEEVLGPIMPLYPQLEEATADVERRFRLHPVEARFLRRIDGHTTVRELIDTADLDSLQARRVMTALVLTDAVNFREQALPKVPSLAPPPRVQAASVRLRADVVGRYLQAIRQAHDAGGAAQAKATAKSSAEQGPRLEGEQAFRRGRQKSGYGQWPLALKEFTRAASLCPAVTEYRLHAVWAQYQIAEEGIERDGARALLDELCAQALREDRELGFAWHVRGQLAMNADDPQKAERAFRHALKLDPDDVDSARYIRLLESRKS